MLTRVRPLAWLLLTLPCLGVGPCPGGPILVGLPTAGGLLPVEIVLSPGTDPAAVSVALDGTDVTSLFAAGSPGLVGALAVPDPGAHTIQVTGLLFPGAPVPIVRGAVFRSPGPAPVLLEATPIAGAAAVTPGAWLRFRLAAPAPPDALVGFGFALECNGRELSRSAHVTPDGGLVLNPSPALPAGASCRVVWRDENGDVAEHAFGVAPDAGAAVALYDRRDPLALAPFPDDFFTRADRFAAERPRDRAAGAALRRPVPAGGLHGARVGGRPRRRLEPRDADRAPLQPPARRVSHPRGRLGGAGPARADRPRRRRPREPRLRQAHRVSARAPERRRARRDAGSRGAPLPRHRPARARALRGGRETRGLRRRYARPTGRPVALLRGAPGGAGRLRGRGARAGARRARPTLETLASLPGVPIPPEDVALALQLSIRTAAGVVDDLTAIKELALASPPPGLVLPDLAVNACPTPANFCIRTLGTRALEVRGRVRLPDFREGAGQQIFRATRSRGSRCRRARTRCASC